ncbi:MAG: sporulation protein YabP [Clostridiales bacterium]|nr:sporulation protein YabP [Clostridiales bacterium]
MNIENIKEHSISLRDRSKASLSGILSIDGFDENNIIMRTCNGGLTIQGSGLHIDRFDSETGDMTISGTVDAIAYFEVKKSGKKTLFGGKRG